MTTLVRFSAHAAITRRPVVAEPVNASTSMSGCELSAAPVSPNPVSSCAAGSPPSAAVIVSTSHAPTAGVSSLGLKTTALPPASA